MKREEVLNKLVEQLKKLIENDYEFSEDTILAEASITSIGFVKLLIFAESEFDIIFSDDDLLMTNDITLGNLVDKIFNLQTLNN